MRDIRRKDINLGQFEYQKKKKKTNEYRITPC